MSSRPYYRCNQLFKVLWLWKRNDMPPARETPPGPDALGMNVWPRPTKTPLVARQAERAPMPKRCLMRAGARI